MNWVKLSLVSLCLLTACATERTGFQPQEVDPDRSVESHTRLASGYYNIARYKIAIDEARIALSIKSDYAPAYNVLGLVYMALKDNVLAEENFQKAISLAVDDSDINHNYGVFLCQTNREKESIAYFTRAGKNPLYQNPERSLANAGYCLRKIGQFDEARTLFERALRLQPQYTMALYNLADIAYRNEDYLPARNYLQRISQDEQTPESLFLAWRVERALGDASAEKRIADQLMRDFPKSDQAKQLR